MEIYETKERKLIKEIFNHYGRWEQAEITDLDFFVILKELAEKGIGIIEQDIEILAEKYLSDLELQKLDIDDLEQDKRDFENREQEYIDAEVENEVKELKEQRKVA
jgi:hypothetical protein